jgi:U3 small nucleolar RNA-associated protein 18
MDKTNTSQNNKEKTSKDTETSASASASTPLWFDTEDDVEINLTAGPNRLRKLRHQESETHISLKEFESRLRTQFEKLHPTPSWAKTVPDATSFHQSSSTGDDSILSRPTLASSLLKSCEPLTASSLRNNLPPTRLDVYRLKDANQMSPSSSSVLSVQFHPTAPSVLFTAGKYSILSLKRNPIYSNG